MILAELGYEIISEALKSHTAMFAPLSENIMREAQLLKT